MGLKCSIVFVWVAVVVLATVPAKSLVHKRLANKPVILPLPNVNVTCLLDDVGFVSVRVECVVHEWLEKNSQIIQHGINQDLEELESNCKTKYFEARIGELKLKRDNIRDIMLKNMNKKNQERLHKFFNDIFSLDYQLMLAYFVYEGNLKVFQLEGITTSKNDVILSFLKSEDRTRIINTYQDTLQDAICNRQKPCAEYSGISEAIKSWRRQEKDLFPLTARFKGRCIISQAIFKEVVKNDMENSLWPPLVGLYKSYGRSENIFIMKQHLIAVTHHFKAYCDDIKKTLDDQRKTTQRKTTYQNYISKTDIFKALTSILHERMRKVALSGGKTLNTYLYLENWLLPVVDHPVNVKQCQSFGQCSPDELGLLELRTAPKGTPIPHKGIAYKSDEKCNGIEASQIFDGVREHEGKFVWDCHTSLRLCQCLVFIGENGKTVDFVSEKPAETLRLEGDGDSVKYEFGSRRRRLLGKRSGNS